jgi:hypothetical protein
VQLADQQQQITNTLSLLRASQKQIDRLLELDRQQGQEIAKLQAASYVLMQMLTEAGAIDTTQMNNRVQAAFLQLEADPNWNRVWGV